MEQLRRCHPSINDIRKRLAVAPAPPKLSKKNAAFSCEVQLNNPEHEWPAQLAVYFYLLCVDTAAGDKECVLAHWAPIRDEESYTFFLEEYAAGYVLTNGTAVNNGKACGGDG